jgi:hypothetical protein
MIEFPAAIAEGTAAQFPLSRMDLEPTVRANCGRSRTHAARRVSIMGAGVANTRLEAMGEDAGKPKPSP